MKTPSLLPIDPAESADATAKPSSVARMSHRSGHSTMSFAAAMHRAETPSPHARAEASPDDIRSNPHPPAQKSSSSRHRSTASICPKGAGPKDARAISQPAREANSNRAVIASTPVSPRAVAAGESSATESRSDGSDTADSDSPAPESSGATIVPLSGVNAAATIVPLPVAGGECEQGSQITATNSEPAVATLPISLVPGETSSAVNSAGRSADTDAGASVNANLVENGIGNDSPNQTAIDLRQLGLESVSQRERRTLQLREAIARLEAQENGNAHEVNEDPSAQDPGATIIPFPTSGRLEESKIINVQFRPDQVATAPESAESGAATQLPGEAGRSENSAQLGRPAAGTVAAVEKTEGTKEPLLQPPFRSLGSESPAAAQAQVATGTSAARKAASMESRPSFASIHPVENVAESSPVDAGGTAAPTTKPELNSGLGTDWASPRVETAERSNASTSSSGARGNDAAGAIERIAKLVGREVVLFRQSNSESMSVVLRPDAQTELMLHLCQRNGQIEATVRCERGDFHQLNALWSQLQESLAQQKVRLAPLEAGAPETAYSRQGSGFSQPGRDEFSRQGRSSDEFMEEWPAPASPQHIPASVRSRRESGHRLSTSRPGWETWA